MKMLVSCTFILILLFSPELLAYEDLLDDALKGCPEGTTLQGEGPPKGDHVFCGYKRLGGYFKKGPFIQFYENGKAKSVTVYKDNRKHGAYALYDQNGNLTETGNHHYGKLHGLQTKYNGLGEPYHQNEFKDGVMTSSKEVSVATGPVDNNGLEIVSEQRFICDGDQGLYKDLKKAFISGYPEHAEKIESASIPPVTLIEMTVQKSKKNEKSYDQPINFKFATKLKIEELNKEVSEFYESIESSISLALMGSLAWKINLAEIDKRNARAPASEKQTFPATVEEKGRTYYITRLGYSIYDKGNLTHVRNIQMDREGVMQIPKTFEIESKPFKLTKEKVSIKFELKNCRIL